MESRFALHSIQGKLFCQDDGMRCVLCAEAPDNRQGLYKVYVQGAAGQMLLGTMMPEGNMLRLRRSMSIAELRRQGCWPLKGAEAELSFAFDGAREAVPEGWEIAKSPDTLVEDEVLRQCVGHARGLLLRREENGFLLAAPYGERSPFPLTPLFCFASLRQIGHRRYVFYRFSRDGKPKFLHETGR